eukprot:GEMP01012581.1.p1 GENE.GEMP01012581.1~~GEMP01012581.1.p1  ORF type:complete len:266 (+),score=73.55 GEMP01012581.1:269-1066(+)
MTARTAVLHCRRLRWSSSVDKHFHYNFTPDQKAHMIAEKEHFRNMLSPLHHVAPSSSSSSTVNNDVTCRGFAASSVFAVPWLLHAKAAMAALRIHDSFADNMCNVVMERMGNAALLARFHVTQFEPRGEKSLHWKTKPKETAYYEVQRRIAFMGMHAWLLHHRQHTLQPAVPLTASALLTLLDRRVLDWMWVCVRLWMAEADVPPMSIEYELKDFQEDMFGFFVALDEALQNCEHTAEALEDAAPIIKYVLASNVYLGQVWTASA